MYATPTAPTAHKGRRLQGDEGLHINFFLEAIESPLESAETGRPVFKDMEMIEIRIPGDEKTIIKTHADEEYKWRFPDEYGAFKANVTLPETGTPLTQWGVLSPSQVAQLQAVNVRTVEALAGLADGNAQFMGSNELRAKAKAFLKATADTAIVEKQEAAMTAQAAEMAELRAQITALSEKKSK